MIPRAGVFAVVGLIVAGGAGGVSSRICLTPLLCAEPLGSRSLAVGADLSRPYCSNCDADGAQASAPAPKTKAPTEPVSASELQTAIGKLGAFEYADRARAAQIVRRAPGPIAVPALLQATGEHADGYVRYRALVLLSTYADPRVPDEMERLSADPNDRLRAVAYAYFEKHPDVSLVPQLLEAFEKEIAEFVRPALARALAAHGSDAKVRAALVRDVTRGQDFFRSTVIEALGDYKATYATKAIVGVATLEGPLQDDAALALGKIGDKSQIAVLAGLQQTAPRQAQPAVAAAICLLGSNCDVHRGYLVKILAFADKIPGYQDLLRGATAGLAALAERGDGDALSALIDAGIPAQESTRAPIALALASVAVKSPAAILAAFEARPDRPAVVELLRDGFDMLEEDFAEEGFYVTIRRAYWAAAAGSDRRATAQEIIQKLEF
jgi:HEAT repeat protein